MTAHVKDAGVWKPVNGIYVKDAGVWKAVSAGYVRDAGVWKQFFSSGGGGGGGGGGRSVTLSPSPADGFRQLNNFNPTGYVSVNITATPSGFTNPTYQWSRISAASSGGAFSASNALSQTVTLGKTCNVFVTYTETWRCIVTESGNPSATAQADVVVSLLCENMS